MVMVGPPLCRGASGAPPRVLRGPFGHPWRARIHHGLTTDQDRGSTIVGWGAAGRDRLGGVRRCREGVGRGGVGATGRGGGGGGREGSSAGRLTFREVGRGVKPASGDVAAAGRGEVEEGRGSPGGGADTARLHGEGRGGCGGGGLEGGGEVTGKAWGGTWRGGHLGPGGRCGARSRLKRAGPPAARTLGGDRRGGDRGGGGGGGGGGTEGGEAARIGGGGGGEMGGRRTAGSPSVRDHSRPVLAAQSRGVTWCTPLARRLRA